VCNLKFNKTNLWTTLGVSFRAFWYIYYLLSKTGPDGCRETRGSGTREMAHKLRQEFSISKGQIFLFLWLSMSHIKRKSGPLFAPLKRRHVAFFFKKKRERKPFKTKSHVLSLFTHSAKKFRSFSLTLTLLFLPFSSTIEASIKAPNFTHHFYSKSQKEAIFGVVKRTSTLWDFKFQVWVDFFLTWFRGYWVFGRYDG